MSKVSTYTIEIERRIIDTYEVDATSGHVASMELGATLHGEEESPHYIGTREVSRKVSAPRKQTDT